MAELGNENKQKRTIQNFLDERKALLAQEKIIEELRTSVKNEQLEKELAFDKEIAERRKILEERERNFHEQQKKYTNQNYEQQKQLQEIKSDLAKREAQLIEAQAEIETVKKKYEEEGRRNIEQHSKGYVADALNSLGKKEKQYYLISISWSVLGAISLVVALIFFIYLSLATFWIIPNPVTWQFITFSVLKGLISLTLFGALAKYSFVLSNSYMQEALKNSDRAHAINFGKFYLESFGAAADWSQVKEAFANWNILGSSSFSNNSPNKSESEFLTLISSAVKNHKEESKEK